MQVALEKAWDLLADLGHPAGELWHEQKSPVLNQLKVRNHSLFAHGFTPATFASWREMWGKLQPFLKRVIATQPGYKAESSLPQSPQTLAELEAGEMPTPRHTTAT